MSPRRIGLIANHGKPGADELVHERAPRGLQHRLVLWPPQAVRYVLPDRRVEHHRVLRDQAYLPSQRAHRARADVMTVDENPPRGGVQQPWQQ